MSNESRISIAASWAVVIIPIVTATLYFVGKSFQVGYFEPFNIDSSLFPMTVDETLYRGFFAVLDMSFISLYYVIGVAGIVILLCYIAQQLKPFHFLKSPRYLNRSKSREDDDIENEIAISITGAIEFVGFGLVYLFLIILGIIGISALSKASGEKYGHLMLKSFELGEKKSSESEIWIDNESTVIRGNSIDCGGEYCAFFSEGKVLLVRKESLSRIIIVPEPKS